MNNKTVLSVILVLSLIMLVIAGCGSSNSDPSSVAPSNSKSTESVNSEQKVKSDVTIAVAAAQDWIKDWDRKVAEDFTAETGIKVDFQLNPNDQYVNIVKAKLASGEGVDIFYGNSGYGLIEYSPDKYCFDLSNEDWVSRYKDWGKDAATYKGKIVLLNTGSIDGWAMLYNTELLAQAEKEVPKTFEDLMALCKVYADMGITPIYEPGADNWHACVWLLETGDFLSRKYPDMYDKLRTPEGKFSDYPEILTFTEQLNEIVKAGYFGPEELWLSQTWDDRSAQMASGKFGMMVAHVAAATEIHKNFPEAGADKWEMSPIPLAGNNTFSHSGGGMGRAINKESKYTEEAKQYFSFIARPENIQYLYDNGTSPDCAFEGVKLRESSAWNSLMTNCGQIVGPDYAAGIPFYSADPIGKAYIEMFIGDKTPEQVIEQIDNDRATMFGVTQ